MPSSQICFTLLPTRLRCFSVMEPTSSLSLVNGIRISSMPINWFGCAGHQTGARRSLAHVLLQTHSSLVPFHHHPASFYSIGYIYPTMLSHVDRLNQNIYFSPRPALFYNSNNLMPGLEFWIVRNCGSIGTTTPRLVLRYRLVEDGSGRSAAKVWNGCILAHIGKFLYASCFMSSHLKTGFSYV
jgi:hypothetical protein